MKRIATPSAEPNVLAAFRNANPSGTWSQFKSEPGNESVFDALAVEQGFICAYCEIRVCRPLRGQVEHYHPKSASQPGRNLHLAFDNLLACCEGGETPWMFDRAESPIGETRHCGALKGSEQPEGHMLDPREIPASPLIWRVTSRGELEVDRDVCVRAGVDPELAEATLLFLGLNRRVLTRLRAAAVEDIDQQIADRPFLETSEEIASLLLPNQRGELIPFWSTIRARLGPCVEAEIFANVSLIPGLR